MLWAPNLTLADKDPSLPYIRQSIKKHSWAQCPLALGLIRVVLRNTSNGHKEAMKHFHKKREKSLSAFSSKKRTSSPTPSKSGENPCPDMGMLRAHREHSTTLPALKSKSASTPVLVSEARLSPVSARKKQQTPSMLTVLLCQDKELSVLITMTR